MGICASKCFPSPTASMSDPESPRPHDIDKLVLSSLTLTTPPPPTNPFSENPKTFSKFQIHPSPPSSSSSSSSNPSTTMITSASTTSSTSYSYTSTYSTNNSSSKFQPPKKKTFSDEFILSCAKENSNTKTPNEKEKPRISQVTIPSPQNRPMMTKGLTPSYSSSNLRQRTNSNMSTSIKIDQSIQAKRARSVSPASRTGRKTIRSETGPIKTANRLNLNTTTKPRMGTLPLPQRKLISSQKGPVNVIKRDLKVPTMEKKTDLVQISEDSKMGELEEEEVVSRERDRTPPPLVEDLNNPLIAMDCFIFL